MINLLNKGLRALFFWIKMNQKQLLKVLWAIVQCSRGLILIVFVILFNMNLIGLRVSFKLQKKRRKDGFYKNVFLKLRPLIVTSLLLHFLYMFFYFYKM
jgi:hypothetical protein